MSMPTSTVSLPPTSEALREKQLWELDCFWVEFPLILGLLLLMFRLFAQGRIHFRGHEPGTPMSYPLWIVLISVPRQAFSFETGHFGPSKWPV